MSQPKHTNDQDWNSPRWKGITRSYTPADVDRLRGTVHIEHTLARLGAEKFWNLLRTEPYIAALGALTGNQAVEMAQAGLKAIYLSGWQVAADANLGGQMYPDQSLYPVNSVPTVVRSINNALLRADQISHCEGRPEFDWMLPIVADAEAGFGGNLNAFELTKAMIEAGAAAVHFEDQLSSAKKCGHLGGKVLVPTEEATQKLVAARLAADTMGVPTVIIARTDANSAGLITSDYDARDRSFITGERTVDGFYIYRGGLQAAIARGSGLCSLRRRAVVRDLRAEPQRGARICQCHSRAIPRQDAGLQLLSFVPLEVEAERGRYCLLPARLGGHGIPFPVRNPRRLPCT